MSSIGEDNEDFLKEMNIAGPGDKKQFDFAGDTFSQISSNFEPTSFAQNFP